MVGFRADGGVTEERRGEERRECLLIAMCVFRDYTCCRNDFVGDLVACLQFAGMWRWGPYPSGPWVWLEKSSGPWTWPLANHEATRYEQMGSEVSNCTRAITRSDDTVWMKTSRCDLAMKFHTCPPPVYPTSKPTVLSLVFVGMSHINAKFAHVNSNRPRENTHSS